LPGSAPQCDGLSLPERSRPQERPQKQNERAVMTLLVAPEEVASYAPMMIAG
jgi:hypothetical protein